MYELSHVFRFIDPIKIKPKQSKSIKKNLELFSLTLNTVNIETLSGGTAGVCD